MRNKYFNKKENHRCGCCVHGVVSEYMSEVFCKKKGLMDKYDCCSSFKYDVLKRVPNTPDISKNYKPEDFEL